jgi:hypothetical protein
MVFDVRQVDLRKLNSLTKYPSIPTYHTMGPRNGILLDEFLQFEETVLATEKVDGTNARIVFTPGRTFLLGSREEFLYARGDLIGNPSMGVVDALRPLGERLCDTVAQPDAVVVYFGELYGGKITANSKQYTTTQRVGFRLFDVIVMTDFEAQLDQPAESISTWREGGGQAFVDEEALQAIARHADIPLTPRIAEISRAELPTTLPGGAEFLARWMTHSQCTLDDAAAGRPEGLVIRTRDRRRIAKLRFEDYQRTLRQK